VTVRSDHVDWLAREAARVGVTISHFLERLIADAIRRRESLPKEPPSGDVSEHAQA
jgi:hypothetical protein